VNLAQILSAIPEKFNRQTKKQTDSAKNRTFRSSLRAVIKVYQRPVAQQTCCTQPRQRVYVRLINRMQSATEQTRWRGGGVAQRVERWTCDQ